MYEESTTPELVELTRRSFAAASRRDFDALVGFFAADAVWEAQELQAFEGRDAIRGFFEYVLGTYHDAEIEVEDVLDLGGGIGFVTASLEGQLADSTAHMRTRMGAVYTWADNLIVRVASYADIDDARAAAERLAEEPRWAMSENLNLVRSIYAAWEEGDFSSAEWADPEIEFVVADGTDPGVWTGIAGMAEAWREVLSLWEDVRTEVDEYRELDDGRVFTFLSWTGRAGRSGFDLARVPWTGANLFHVRDGEVVKLVLYWDRERALADLGLAE